MNFKEKNRIIAYSFLLDALGHFAGYVMVITVALINDSQCLLGIALGRSEYTNGMIFYNPELDSFYNSAD